MGMCRICRSVVRSCSSWRVRVSRYRRRRWWPGSVTGSGMRAGWLADTERVPVVRFAKHARKLDVMRPHLDRQAATGRSGIAGIGVAQELQWLATCSTRPARGAGAPHCAWGRAERRVSCFYF